MKYYAELAKLKCFTRTDLEKITGNKNTAGSILKAYQEKGYVKLVKRNLYAVVSLETDGIIASRYNIANALADGACLSHHTAFEYYGCANQVFHTVYVSSRNRFTPFEFEDVAYKYVQSRLDVGVVKNADGVCVTDMERTIIDSLNDFEKIGGIEEILHCLELIPYVDEKKLLIYLKYYNKQFLYQKAGYILSHFKDVLRLSDAFFEKCEESIGKSVRYLCKGVKTGVDVFDGRWQLFVPQKLMVEVEK